MKQAAVPALLSVLSGTFHLQPRALAALRDAADSLRLRFRLEDVDVIGEAGPVRLAHYFRPAIVARIQELQGDDDTVIVIRPCPLTATPLFPPMGGRLRLLGRFAGEISETTDGSP